MSDTLKAAAELALKHTGDGTWSTHDLVVVGSIDKQGLKSFCVAEVDTDEELPDCAGEAIAAYIGEVHPAVVLALIADRDRWAARVKLLEERIGHSVDVLRGRADAMFDEESVAETDRILRFFGFDRLADETADEEANRA